MALFVSDFQVNHLYASSMHLNDCFAKRRLRRRSQFDRIGKAVHGVESYKLPKRDAKQPSY